MSSVEERVKKLICEQLGVKEEEVKDEEKKAGEDSKPADDEEKTMPFSVFLGVED